MTKRKKIFVAAGSAVLAVVITALGIMSALGSFTEYKPSSESIPGEAPLGYIEDNSQTLKIYNTPNMRLMSDVVTAEENSTVTNYITLTATVLPEGASTEIDWSVEFENPSAAWAQGKNAADYVSAIPETDGANTVTVYALQPFAEPIKIIATSRVNSSAVAYAVAGYYQRLSDMLTITFDNTCFSDTELSNDGSVYTVKPIMVADIATLSSFYSEELHINFEFTDSTEFTNVFENGYFRMVLVLNENFKNALISEGLLDEDGTNGLMLLLSEDDTLISGISMIDFYSLFCGVIPVDGSSESYEKANAFNRIISNLEDEDFDFEIKISGRVSLDSGVKIYSIPCKFDRENIEYFATDFNMSKTDFNL